ncbi:MAG: hypothetical protein R3F05_04620 [Planctomycetota bacterium]
MVTRAESDDARARYFAVQVLGRSMPRELGMPLLERLDFKREAASAEVGRAAAAWLRAEPGRVRAVFPSRFPDAKTVETLMAHAAEKARPALDPQRVAGRWSWTSHASKEALTLDLGGTQTWSTEPAQPVPKNSWNSRSAAGTWCTWRGLVWTFTDRLDNHREFAFLEAFELVGDELRGIDRDIVYRRADD